MEKKKWGEARLSLFPVSNKIPDSISLRIKIRRGFSPQSRAIHSFVYRRAFRGCLRMFLDSNLTRSVEQSRRSFLFVPLAESGRETGNRFKPGNFSTLPSWFYQKLFFPAFFHSLAELKYSTTPRKIKMEYGKKKIYFVFHWIISKQTSSIVVLLL